MHARLDAKLRQGVRSITTWPLKGAVEIDISIRTRSPLQRALPAFPVDRIDWDGAQKAVQVRVGASIPLLTACPLGRLVDVQVDMGSTTRSRPPCSHANFASAVLAPDPALPLMVTGLQRRQAWEAG